MARTKRTCQPSSTTEQETEKNEQDKNISSTNGEETAVNAIGSDKVGDDKTSNILDKENGTEPTNQDKAKPTDAVSTYTFKRPMGISQEEINYKVFKIQSMFGYLAMDEVHRMLEDCGYNEDEVTMQLITRTDYLTHIQDLLKNPCPTSSASTPSTSSADTTATGQQSTSSASEPQSHSPISHLPQQQFDYYHLPQMHEFPQHYQDQVPTSTNIVPSQLCMTTYQTQQPYYRALQPLPALNPLPISPSFPLLAPDGPHNTNITATSAASTATATTSATMPTTTEETTSPTPVKRGNNYGKKYKKRKPTNPVPPPSPMPSMDDYESMPPTPIPSTSAAPLNKSVGKKRVRSVGRLALDDALKQVANNPTEQLQAYEGWSAARIRAFGLINTNPNTYYYRFNAPGEEQRKGAWTAEEKAMFLERVQEVGANAQWGIFSKVIPGRVGYQCSNFYRLLIEIGELQDSNYIVDDAGKAHYLFDKKTATGEIQKTVRNHYKHKKNRNTEDTPVAPKKPKMAKKKKPKKCKPWEYDDDYNDDDDDDDDDDEYTGKPSKAKKTGTRHSTRRCTVND